VEAQSGSVAFWHEGATVSATYYVRIAGKVYGAFDAERLKAFAAGGKLARDHEISRDRVKWVPAGNVKGLFPAAQLVVEPSPRPVPVEAIAAPSPTLPARDLSRDPIPTSATPLPRRNPVFAKLSRRAPPTNRRFTATVVRLRGNLYAIAAVLTACLALAGCWISSLEPFLVPLAFLAIVLAAFGFLVAGFRGGAGRLTTVGGAVVAVLAIGISTAGQVEHSPPPTTSLPEWADSALPQQIGDVRVGIAAVAIGKVPLEGLFDEGQSTDPLLIVRVTIENLSRSRKIDFRGFDPEVPALEFAQLTDNHENSYRRVGFGAAKPKGQVKIDSIYPGKSIDDLLVFEIPVETAKYLRLELPAKNVGREGTFRFQISSAAIQR
jgi:hypothetical protein